MNLRDKIARTFESIACSRRVLQWRLPDIDPATLAVYERVSPFTMTSPQRVASLCDAVRYVVSAKVPGSYVECGVWRGGSSMAAALSFMAAGDTTRYLDLFDTFEGMSSPSKHDVRAQDGASAAALLARADRPSRIWCQAGIDDVVANMESVGYPSDKIRFHKGMVEDTLPSEAPDEIAILRLDTDWYESTRHELETLYPRLCVGGVLIIDDYGYWRGARKAVDEYFDDRQILLNRIDHTGRIALKVRE